MYDKDGSGCIDKTELLEIVEVLLTIIQSLYLIDHLKEYFEINQWAVMKCNLCKSHCNILSCHSLVYLSTEESLPWRAR